MVMAFRGRAGRERQQGGANCEQGGRGGRRVIGLMVDAGLVTHRLTRREGRGNSDQVSTTNYRPADAAAF